jgi:hypothetical protein
MFVKQTRNQHQGRLLDDFGEHAFVLQFTLSHIIAVSIKAEKYTYIVALRAEVAYTM